MTPVDYSSSEEDNARWSELRPTAGDIVVSTRSKHGTTWVQTILLMLIHGPDLPDRLPVLSPWLDHLVEPIEEVTTRLDAQPHRRVIKTHTPLDGLPLNDETTYVVVARDPLDAALSLYHQAANIDRARRAELTGTPLPQTAPELPDVSTWLRRWITSDQTPADNLDSLAGVLHHLQTAWNRRDSPNILLVRYADLVTDRAGQIQRLARILDLYGHDLDAIYDATSLENMRANARALAPDARGELRDRSAFFRQGVVGESTRHLETSDLTYYHRRVEDRLPRELFNWLYG